MMYFKKTLDSIGGYTSSNGIRYSISYARRIRTRSGVNVDYVPFVSLAAALQAWGLSPTEQEVEA